MRASRQDGQGDMPRRRVLKRRAAGRPRTDSERIAAVAAEADMPVEDVLREVADFRLALETDMIIAAAAVEADNPDVLSEVIDGERLELATFHDRLMERLAEAAAEDELATRRARREPKPRRFTSAIASAAAVLALVAFAGGAATRNDATTPAAAMTEADQHYADFSSAVSSDSSVAVQQAAAQLHDTLEQLIADHASDPEVAQRAAQLLQAEISLLRANDPDGASHVLAQARNLVSMLERKAPPKVRDAVRPVLDAASESTKPKASASPKSTPSPKPKPTSSPRPSGSAQPSSGPSANPLDTP